LKSGRSIRVGQIGYAPGDFSFARYPGAALPADTAAPSLEARQTRALRAREVGLNSWIGWGGLGEHYGEVRFV
jgi:hypothetical protein